MEECVSDVCWTLQLLYFLITSQTLQKLAINGINFFPFLFKILWSPLALRCLVSSGIKYFGTRSLLYMSVGLSFSHRNFTVLQAVVFARTLLKILLLISAEISVEALQCLELRIIGNEGVRKKYGAISMFTPHSLTKKHIQNHILIIAYCIVRLIVLYVSIFQHLWLQKYRCHLSKMHSSEVRKSNKQTNKQTKFLNTN